MSVLVQEATNLHPGCIEEIYKIASINLSPNIMGQVSCNTAVNDQACLRCCRLLHDLMHVWPAWQLA